MSQEHPFGYFVKDDMYQGYIEVYSTMYLYSFPVLAFWLNKVHPSGSCKHLTLTHLLAKEKNINNIYCWFGEYIDPFFMSKMLEDRYYLL